MTHSEHITVKAVHIEGQRLALMETRRGYLISYDSCFIGETNTPVMSDLTLALTTFEAYMERIENGGFCGPKLN